MYLGSLNIESEIRIVILSTLSLSIECISILKVNWEELIELLTITQRSDVLHIQNRG